MEAQEDENPYTITTPPRADYKDVNADTEVCIYRTHFLQSIEPFILPCSQLL